METHTCTCCNLTFTAPTGFISGTPKQQRTMTHNYAQMVRNPLFGPRLAAQNVTAA